MIKDRNKPEPVRLNMPQRGEDDEPVYGNLAVTPSDMYDMMKRGIPISAQNAGMNFHDGEKNPSWDLPLDRLRGVDPAQMWEQSQVIKLKAKRAHIRDREKFGDD